MPRDVRSHQIDPDDTYTWTLRYWIWRLSELAAMIGFLAFFFWRTAVALSVIQQEYDMHPSGLLDWRVWSWMALCLLMAAVCWVADVLKRKPRES